MKKLIIFILSGQITWSAWSMDSSAHTNYNHFRSKSATSSNSTRSLRAMASNGFQKPPARPSSRSSLSSNGSSTSSKSQKSFTLRRRSSEKSPRRSRKSSSSLKNGSAGPKLYETSYEKYTKLRSGIDDTTINVKSSIIAWKWYAQYLEEHPQESMKPYSQTVRDNLNLFREMKTATQENPDELQYIDTCNAQYQKLWHLIDGIEEYNTLNKQIENKHIEDSEITGQKTGSISKTPSISQLTRKRSNKNLFIKLFYPLSDTLKDILTGIRSGDKKSDGTDRYTFADLFDIYNMEQQIHSSERKRNSLNRKHSDLLSKRRVAQEDSESLHYQNLEYIAEKTDGITRSNWAINAHETSHTALEKKFKSINKRLGFLSTNGTASATTSK